MGNTLYLPNGWESVGVIGRGSSGTVYRAKRTIGRNTEWAAVKHISMPSDPDELNTIRAELGTADENTVNEYLYESLQDMLGEYFQMKSLQGHTNIVACQDIQQIPKSEGLGYDVYIWMELLESLSNRIIEGKMDRDETIRMGMNICQALSLLKSKRIVHRDIKPQNIFVNEHGDYKLGDFGSARGIKGTSTVMSMKGTFSYTAPEIMRGEKAGFSSDIYSLGLVMYRLMNRNRHPFIQEGDISSARGIEDSNFRRFGGEALPMPVDVDEELGRIILKACAFEPRNRWQTPEEMFNALAALNEGTTVQKYQSSVTDTSGNVAQGEDSIKTTHSTDKESSITSKNQNSQEEISTTTKTQSKTNTDSHEEERKTAISHGKKKPLVFIIAAVCILLLSVVAIIKLNGKKESQGTTVAMTTEATSSTPTPTPNATSAQTPTNPYVSVSVGDIITFGKYEQDNNFSNGPEPLQWIVLRKDGSSLLVITEKVIDCKPFNTQYCKLRWRSCDLRAWLNGDFMDSAFSYAERQMISETSVADAGNTDKGIGPGKSTVDSIFLLSKEEAAKWFDSDGTRLAKPTKYAIHQGILTNDNGYCWWWLRNPGVDLDHASVISPTGSIYSSGDRVSRKDWGVRPVMWIDIGS